MFTPKANSKRKRVKNVNFSRFAWQEFGGRFWQFGARFLPNQNTRKPRFHPPKSQILISQHPNLFQKIVYRYIYSKGLSKHNKHEIKHHSNTIYKINPFLQKPSTTTQFTIFTKTQQHTTTTHQSWINSCNLYHPYHKLLRIS